MSGTDYTLTTNYGLYKPIASADINQWGAHLNTNVDKLDSLLSGFLPLTGSLTVGAGSGAPTLTLNGAVNTAGIGVQWQTAGTNRWLLQTDASDNLALHAYDASGVWKGMAAQFANNSASIVFNFPLFATTSNATAAGAVTGLTSQATNTGQNVAEGVKFTYFSSAGGGGVSSGGFDIGLTTIAIFDPASWSTGPAFPSYDGAWIVVVSPNDATHGWAANGFELDVVNRGADMGFKRDRVSANPTGGIMVAAETATFGGPGGGEGKNASFAYTVTHSANNNSTGFPARFYTGYLVEPNSVVGLTGRGSYMTGDITGTASQYPYGPIQTDGTWLHGFDHTLATYVGGNAENMLVGQSLAWITGTTQAPTGTARIGASGSGANLSLTLTPAGTGTINYGVMPANAANDAAAATAGVSVGGTYRNGSVLQVRVA